MMMIMMMIYIETSLARRELDALHQSRIIIFEKHV